MQGVFAQYARGPGFESWSGLVLPPSRDIWWLSVGPCSDCEQQSDSLVSLALAQFQAGSGTNLFKQGEIVTGRSSGSSARMVWESSWVRVPVGPCASSFSVTIIP